MKNYIKTIASTMVMFAMALSAFATPISFATAFTVSNESSSNSSSVGSSSSSITSCNIDANRYTVTTGESVTINWDTSGFTDITINGESVSGNSGSKVYTNMQVRTIFRLEATNNSGSTCVQQVTVNCVPPVQTFCELEVTKEVDKASAVVGEILTYTMVVRNVGDADCTGTGVKIEDVLDVNLEYVSHQVTANISSGYNNLPVYTSSDRTLHFNGEELFPGEGSIISVVAKVKAPTQCGDFKVRNQAKATAKELNNFQTWAYSPNVVTNIDNDCVVPVPTCDSFTANPTAITTGGKTTLAWETTNANQVSINNGIGSVLVDGSKEVYPTTNTTYKLTAVGADNKSVDCEVIVTVSSVPVPTCDSFTANPTAITTGGKTTLSWETTNANQVLINNGIGQVSPDGNQEVSPIADTVYKLTVFGDNNVNVDCSVTVTVSAVPVPVCEVFTATPNQFVFGGGTTNLNWKVINATEVTIDQSVGSVGLIGNKDVNVTESKTFKLTAKNSKGDEVSCSTSVTVDGPNDPFTCSNNVDFTISDRSITRGDEVTLEWNTTDVDTVSISEINETSLSGSEEVSPSSDITYTLTATKGNETIKCPVSVDVSTGGGGGGGSSSPRCELDISDTKIKLGEEITLEWDTSRATEVTLTDDKGKVLFTTDDYLSNDKEDYYDGSIDLRPTRDTEYTLLAERGSRDEECKVEVEIDDNTVVLQTRDQQPLVAGISLSQVPYTGFEAGPMMTVMFYMLLVAWALYVTYLLVIRKKLVESKNDPIMDLPTVDMHSHDSMQKAESINPNVFVSSVTTVPDTHSSLPVNLPTDKKTIGYDNHFEEGVIASNQISDSVVTELENRAHSQRALLSSDAVRYFIGSTDSLAERNEALDEVIVEAKKNYPLEDGWMVINESRMQNLCEVCKTVSGKVPQTVPAGAGSLAEAIVTGNVIAAYEMIGSRPMFALADAAADLDAVYRNRKGEGVSISELLLKETTELSDEKIKNMITALTGAIDGTYTDEASAVKMAIMKAVKQLA